jgi:hypothetical protein
VASDQDRDEAAPTQSGDKMFATYSNHISMRSGIYDVALTFGLESPDGVQETATIWMSPQHARSLFLLLGRYVAKYEHDIGPIALPKNLVDRLMTIEPVSDGQEDREPS